MKNQLRQTIFDGLDGDGRWRKEAARYGAPPFDLIDGAMLCSLLKNLKLGVQTEMVEKVHVELEWFKQFNDK